MSLAILINSSSHGGGLSFLAKEAGLSFGQNSKSFAGKGGIVDLLNKEAGVDIGYHGKNGLVDLFREQSKVDKSYRPLPKNASVPKRRDSGGLMGLLSSTTKVIKDGLSFLLGGK